MARVLNGQTQSAVARGLEVHLVTVVKWMARHRATGEAGLAARGYSPQRPARKARQRNDHAIVHGVANDWPRIQKAAETGAHLVLIDESGLFLNPLGRRT